MRRVFLEIKQKIFLSAVKIGSDNILLYLNSKNNKTIILKEIEKLGELLHINIVDVIFA